MNIADYKFHGGDHEAVPEKAEVFLNNPGVDESVIKEVCDIIRKLSFSGADCEESKMTLPLFQEISQSSNLKFSTRLNSFILCVISVISFATDIEAIIKSFGPMGVPFFSS